MFNTLESSWDHSARRGWSAIASFTFQAMALSLLVAIPMLWVQAPPSLHWLQPVTAQIAQPPAPQLPHEQAAAPGNPNVAILVTPPSIPPRILITDDSPIAPPDLTSEVLASTGSRSPEGVLGSTGTATPMVTLKPPPPTHPLKVSRWSEGNLTYRVQPIYPPLARQARIQGAVQLRAIISKTGTIEHLTLESGHPMLAGAALDAVRQWRYRPYLLNDEPIEIETEITVNFLLSGN